MCPPCTIFRVKILPASYDCESIRVPSGVGHNIRHCMGCQGERWCEGMVVIRRCGMRVWWRIRALSLSLFDSTRWLPHGFRQDVHRGEERRIKWSRGSRNPHDSTPYAGVCTRFTSLVAELAWHRWWCG